MCVCISVRACEVPGRHSPVLRAFEFAPQRGRRLWETAPFSHRLEDREVNTSRILNHALTHGVLSKALHTIRRYSEFAKWCSPPSQHSFMALDTLYV